MVRGSQASHCRPVLMPVDDVERWCNTMHLEDVLLLSVLDH